MSRSLSCYVITLNIFVVIYLNLDLCKLFVVTIADVDIISVAAAVTLQKTAAVSSDVPGRVIVSQPGRGWGGRAGGEFLKDQSADENNLPFSNMSNRDQHSLVYQSRLYSTGSEE